MSAREFLFVAHSERADGGRIAEQLRRRGHSISFARPFRGEPLPASPERLAGCVVLGGPMSANDDDAGIRAELDWLAKVLRAEVPLLGVCLGAQLMARVLGARVWPHADEVVEIGFHRLVPTEAGRACFPTSAYFYQWHREGFDVPAGACLLAEGEHFANQAFVYGARSYAVQFHPEITAPTMARWIAGESHRLGAPGAQCPSAQWRHHALHDGRVAVWLSRFLDRWLLAREPALPAVAT